MVKYNKYLPCIKNWTELDIAQTKIMVRKRLQLQGDAHATPHVVLRFFHLKESNMGLTWVMLHYKVLMFAFTFKKNDNISISLRTTLKDNFINFELLISHQILQCTALKQRTRTSLWPRNIWSLSRLRIYLSFNCKSGHMSLCVCPGWEDRILIKRYCSFRSVEMRKIVRHVVRSISKISRIWEGEMCPHFYRACSAEEEIQYEIIATASSLWVKW